MAPKKVQQKDVKWIPKDKKTGKGGFLALRSEPTKPFSGIVTNIKAGTTRSSGGEAVYKGGRNVQRMKDRAAAAKGTGAAKESASSYVAKPKTPPATPAKDSYSYTPGRGMKAQTRTAGAYTVPTGRGASSAGGSKPKATTTTTYTPIKIGTRKRFPDGYKRWDGKRWVKV